jgi:hypothetical protein
MENQHEKMHVEKIALLPRHDFRSRWLFIKVMVYFKVVEMKLLFIMHFSERGAGFETRDGGINSAKQLPQYARNSSSLSA